MQPKTIILVWLALFLLQYGWNTLLAALNLRYVRRHGDAVPPAFAGVVDEPAYARSVTYTLTRGRFGLLAGTVSAAILLAVVLSGFMGLLDSLAARLPIGGYLQGVVFLFALSLLFWVTGLPFSLYSVFGIEARFGFNRMTPRLYLVDTLKSLALSVVLAVPVLLGLFWFMDHAGRLWWLWAFLAMSAFELVLNVLYPMVIAPLFNRFTPLADGSLRTRILELAGRLGLRAKGIYVMDGSRRSRHSNAYFTGLGRSKRIVLFDTLVKTMSEEEILAVLAHEIGHERRHHVTKGLVVSLAAGLAGFWILSLLVPWTPLYRAFGFSQAGSAAIVAILALCSGPFTFFFAPLSSLWSRKHEYEADRFAVDGTGGAAAMVSALLRLSKDNLSNLTPHPLYSFWHYSHPTVAERIAAVEAYAARRGLAAAAKPALQQAAGDGYT
jgi:STE24 endopeptidase